MSNPRDRRALARKRAEAEKRFLRDYDDYCNRDAKFFVNWADLAAVWPEDPELPDGSQYLLNLETDDDES